MATPVWISLGSNLGDRRAILDDAIHALGQSPEIVVRSVSSYHETKPIGGPPGQGPFLNAAAHLETTLEPFQLLAVLQEIENQAGRVRVVRWGERTLDLDILIYGTKFLDTKELKLPHPRLALRRFVLEPMAEIAPTIVDTITLQTMTKLLENINREPRLLVLEGTHGNLKSTVFRRLLEELPALGAEWDDLHMDRGQSSDPLQDYLDFWERKVEAHKADRLAASSKPSHWLIADYMLELELGSYIPSVPWPSALRLMSAHQLSIEKEGMGYIFESARKTVSPTLAIALPGSANHRWSRARNIPQLWPESNDPEAIVAEVVATCRGIEAI